MGKVRIVYGTKVDEEAISFLEIVRQEGDPLVSRPPMLRVSADVLTVLYSLQMLGQVPPGVL